MISKNILEKPNYLKPFLYCVRRRMTLKELRDDSAGFGKKEKTIGSKQNLGKILKELMDEGYLRRTRSGTEYQYKANVSRIIQLTRGGMPKLGSDDEFDDAVRQLFGDSDFLACFFSNGALNMIDKKDLTPKIFPLILIKLMSGDGIMLLNEGEEDPMEMLKELAIAHLAGPRKTLLKYLDERSRVWEDSEDDAKRK